MPRAIAMAVSDKMRPGSRQQTIPDAGVIIDPQGASPALRPLLCFIALASRDIHSAHRASVTFPEKSMPLRFSLPFALVLCCMMLPLRAAMAAAAINGDVAGAQPVMAQQAQPVGAPQAQQAQQVQQAQQAQQAQQPGAMQVQSTSTGASTTPSIKQIALAETLLFQTNHLRNVSPASVLMYAFHKAGSLEPGFDDQVKLVVNAGHAAGHAATMVFLSGPRQRQSPEVEDPEGNPVLLGFLERDIAEMHRLTGGSSNYFRKRIRLALADAAQVRPYHFTYAGKGVDGREIVIQPYQHDPMHARFEAYVGKRYTFVVSPQVPGGVYQVRTAAAGANGQPVLVDETLTLVGHGSAR